MQYWYFWDLSGLWMEGGSSAFWVCCRLWSSMPPAYSSVSFCRRCSGWLRCRKHKHNMHTFSSFPRKDTNAYKWSTGATHLRHQSAQSVIAALIWHATDCSFSPFFRKPTLSGPNQIKNLLTPSAVKKMSRLWGRLLEFDLMQLTPTSTRQSISHGGRALIRKKIPHCFEVSFPALCTESQRVVHRMIQPDCCFSAD